MSCSPLVESPALANTLTRRWPIGGRLIAEALGIAREKSGLCAVADVPLEQPGTGRFAAF